MLPVGIRGEADSMAGGSLCHFQGEETTANGTGCGEPLIGQTRYAALPVAGISIVAEV